MIGAVDGGMAVRHAAITFGASIGYIYKALIRRRMTGDSGINPVRGHRLRKLSSEQEVALGAHIRSRLGITLAQAQSWLLTEHGVSLSTGAMWNAARRLGLSFKKRPASRRAGQAGRGGAAKAVEGGQPFIDPNSLVFLDETGVNTKMARLYGWSPMGERCRDHVPFGHWKTLTFLAGLRLSSMPAPWLLDGPMGDAFRIYVQHARQSCCHSISRYLDKHLHK